MSCCVLCFDFPCPHVSFKCLLCPSLCLSVFSSMPSPCYLTCWATSPVPCLVVSVCVFSLCVPCTPCLVIASVCVHAPVCSQFPMVCVFGLEFCILPFDLNFAFDLTFVLLVCTLFSYLSCYFTFVPSLSSFRSSSLLLLLFSFKLKLVFCFPISLPPMCNCIWVQLLSPKPSIFSL